MSDEDTSLMVEIARMEERMTEIETTRKERLEQFINTLAAERKQLEEYIRTRKEAFEEEIRRSTCEIPEIASAAEPEGFTRRPSLVEIDKVGSVSELLSIVRENKKKRVVDKDLMREKEIVILRRMYKEYRRSRGLFDR